MGTGYVVPKLGEPFVVPHNEEHRILGSILSSCALSFLGSRNADYLWLLVVSTIATQAGDSARQLH